jgi:hypothetical protein
MGEFDINPTPPSSDTPPTATPAAAPPEGAQGGDALPDEYKDKSPAELVKVIEDARQSTQAAEEKAQRASEAYTNLAAAAITRHKDPEPSPVPSPPPPDRDEDPEGFINYMVEERVNKALSNRFDPLVEQYRNDRNTLFASNVERGVAAMRNDPRFPGFTEIEDKIMAYAKQFPADQLAQPGALAECYYRVLGQVQAEKGATDVRRSQGNLGDGGRAVHSPAEPTTPTKLALTDAERRAAARADLSPEQFKALQGPGIMPIDEWDQLVEKKKTQGAK